MLSANQQVLFNEIKKKQGRPIFALCRACGLAPADGAKAKLELIQLGVITEHNASSGLYLLVKNGLPEKPKARPKPVENPYQVVRRNEPTKFVAEQNGFMTSEAKRQREETARLEESERTEPAAYVMEKPKPIKEKSLAEQIAEELRWHEQFDREQEELEAEEQTEEEHDFEFDRPETEQDREAIADFDREHAEPEPETESEKMANLSPTALAVLEKARANVNAEEEEETKMETPAPVEPVKSKVVVPLTPGGKPMVNDDMILEFLTNHGPATMATITSSFNRHGSGLATKLHKMVKNKVISERDRVPGSLVVYMTNADYLKEVSSSMPKQVLPVGAKPVNAERGSMLGVRDQTTFTAKTDEEIKFGTAVASTENGMVKVAEQTTFAPLPEFIKEQVKALPQSSFFAEDKPAQLHPGVSVYEPPKTINTGPVLNMYELMNDDEKGNYLWNRILECLASGPKSSVDLEHRILDVPGFEIRKMLSNLNKRRRIIRAKGDIPANHVGKIPAHWQLLDNASRESRRLRSVGDDEILALFPDAETILTTTTIADVFGRTASGLGVTLNALCKRRKLVKCGDSPARYRLANATLTSILEEIENSFTVNNKEDLPDENWLPILNRLETLIGGNAGQVLADIQAYLKRRMKDD